MSSAWINNLKFIATNGNYICTFKPNAALYFYTI